MKLSKSSGNKKQINQTFQSGLNQNPRRSVLWKRHVETLKRRTIKRQRTIFNPSALIRKHGTLLKIVPIFAFILLLFYGLYFLFVQSGYFKIQNIMVSGAVKYVNALDIKKVAGANVSGQNILFYNINDLKDSLSQVFLGASDITVKKKLPNTILIDVKERIPLAIVYNSRSTDSYIVDGDGYVLGTVEDKDINLPRIKYEDEILIGKFIEKDIIPVSAEIIKQAGYEDLKISSVSFFPKYSDLYVNDSVEAKISNNKSISEAIKTISSLVKIGPPVGKILKKIDLRYDKVIVLYD